MVVRKVMDAYLQGDQQAMLELIDPDVVVTQFADQPDAGPHHGHDEMLKAVTNWVDTWDDYAIELVDLEGIGDNVLVALRQRGRGKASGIEMEGHVYFVYTVGAGKIVRWQMFPSEREALEAAGHPQES